MRRIALACALFALTATPVGVRADGLSLSVDFDGSGQGQVYHGIVPPTPPFSPPRAVPGRPAHWYNPRTVPSPVQMQSFEQQRLQEQNAQAQARLVAARIEADRSDRAARLAKLYQLWQAGQAADDDAADVDLRTGIRIRDAMPAFIAQQARDRYAYDGQLRRLSASIDKIEVPAPQICDSILLLGLGATPEVAAQEGAGGNPFTGHPYGCGVYGFASMSDWPDLVLRGIADHYLSSIDLLSPLTALTLHRLESEERIVPVVVAHSNGATIAEVLIRTHRLVGVKELRILGGDGALMHLDDLQKLADDYGIRVTVYAIKGDVVPLTPSGWGLRALGESLSTMVGSYAAPNLTYGLLGLQRAPANPGANLQVTLLDYPPRTNPLDYHPYLGYAGLLKGLRMMGCLAGSNDSRCRVSY